MAFHPSDDGESDLELIQQVLLKHAWEKIEWMDFTIMNRSDAYNTINSHFSFYYYEEFNILCIIGT